MTAKTSEPIRYATAGRFKPPVPLRAGAPPVIDRSICPQLPSRLQGIMGRPRDDLSQSEACLNLVVSTPERVGANRPVMVFFHGGGFTSGSGLLDWYSGCRLSNEGDVVVVSVNYRVGVFGYLVLDGVSDGNLGLLDQLEALRWVRDNIALHGGDPGNVTVFGQSAGAMSILNLLRIDGVAGLFRRAILQSCPVEQAAQTREMAEATGNRLRGHLKMDPVAASSDELLEAHRLTAATYTEVPARLTGPFSPTLATDPIDAGTADEPHDVAGLDIIAGWNLDEMSAFGSDGSRLARDVDETFVSPWVDLARRLEAGGARIHGYRLDWRPPGSPFGAVHCVELPLLLGSEEAWRGSPMLGTTAWADVAAFGRQLRSVWTTFARSGVVDIQAVSDRPVVWATAAEEFEQLRRLRA